MRAGALLLAVLLLLPVAAAQLPVQPVRSTVTVIVIDSGKPAVPERITLAQIQITYQWGSGGAAGEPTRIQLSVAEAPDWAADVSVEPPEILAEVPPNAAAFGGRVQLNATLNFTVVPNAPAYRTGNFTVLAQAAPNGNLAATEGEGILTTRPDFVGNLTLSAPPMVAWGGGWTVIPFTVRNVGNGDTQVRLTARIKPEPSDIELPAPAVIPVNGSGVLEVRLRLPWTVGVDGTLNVTAEGISAVNPRANPVEVEGGTTIDGRSPVPLPGWALLAAGAAGAFLLRKRRNQR